MGTTNKSASKIFVIQGFLLGSVGSILGVAIGLLLAFGFISGTGVLMVLR